MYAYLNDVSAQLPAGASQPALPLLQDVISLLKTLREEYSIQLLKVPKGFSDLKLFNDVSIKELLKHAQANQDHGIFQQLLGFLSNQVHEDLAEVETELENEMENKQAWIEVSHDGQNSMLLTGAFLLDRPVISFNSSATYRKDILICNASMDYINQVKNREAKLKNIYGFESIAIHQAYLILIKREIFFGKDPWDPSDAPIWNDKTTELLEKLDFPDGVLKKMSKINALQYVGRLVAELNSWASDPDLSKLNSNKDHVRKIFVSINAKKTFYLSIDFKNGAGRFELLDVKGRHEGEIEFTTGKFVSRGKNKKGQDLSGKHNIKVS
jgi:hypothetical protein